MKILIVDDEITKQDSIRELLLHSCEVLAEDISCVGCLIHARDVCTTNTFDVIILDLNLPNRDGDAPYPNAGTDFIYELVESKTLRKPLHVIGLTAFPDSLSASQTRFRDLFWDVIYYDPSQNSWKKKITQKISYLLEASSSYCSEYIYHIGIIVSVEVELKSVLQLPGNWTQEKTEHDSITYYKGTFNAHGIALKIVVAQSPNMGMVSSAVTSCKLVELFRPQYLIMAGIMAGVKDTEIQLGDIVIAEQVWDYGSGKYKIEDSERIFLPDPKTISLDVTVRDKLLRIITSNEYISTIQDSWPGQRNQHALKVKMGPVASGASVVQDAQIIAEIKSHNRKLLGLDMESYALYYAAYNMTIPRPTPISIKSVSDYADSEKSDNFQSYAAFTSSHYIYNLCFDLFR